MRSEKGIQQNKPSKTLDEGAWTAICSWPQHADMQLVHKGVDFAHLSRSLLWDKVGRAIRVSVGRTSIETESEHTYPTSDLKRGSSTPDSQKKNANPLFRRLRFIATGMKKTGLDFLILLIKVKLGLGRVPVVLVPVATERIGRIASQLLAQNRFRVFSSATALRGFELAEQVRRVHQLEESDKLFAANLCECICTSLKNFDISLLDTDVDKLKLELEEAIAWVNRARIQLSWTKPQLILLHSDNHLPGQAYVLVARNWSIPTLVVQHGLDCESYYHDEAYASHIAVWGRDRLARYRTESIHQPNIRVTGNPNFDDFTSTSGLSRQGDFWLWVTRPHSTQKCYAPSRSPTEGRNILKALIRAMEDFPEHQLVIKPHPFDCVTPYFEIIEQFGVEERVLVTEQSVHDLLGHARLVLSEDTTAGLEAMIQGKLVVHVHFADSDPVLPLSGYGAALAGRCPDEIRSSIGKALSILPEEEKALLAGQRRFIADYAGELDGKSSKRVIEYVSDILSISKPVDSA